MFEHSIPIAAVGLRHCNQPGDRACAMTLFGLTLVVLPILVVVGFIR